MLKKNVQNLEAVKKLEEERLQQKRAAAFKNQQESKTIGELVRVDYLLSTHEKQARTKLVQVLDLEPDAQVDLDKAYKNL